MGHNIPEFEIKNSEGVSVAYQGNTAAVINDISSIPSIANKEIEDFYIENLAPIEGPFSTPAINIESELYVSIDGGMSFTTVYAGQAFEYNPRKLQQLVIKSNVSLLPYKAIINFEMFDDEGI